MLHLTILLIIIFFMTLWALVIHEGEVFAPSVGMCLGFFIATIAAMMNAAQWGLNDIHWITVAVISGGICLFILVGMFVTLMAKNIMVRRLGHSWQGLDDTRKSEIRIREIGGSRVITFLMILFVIAFMFFYAQSVFDVVRDSGRKADTWRETMSQFRALVSYREGSVQLPFIVEQSHQMLNLMSYVLAYLLTYQYVFCNRKNVSLYVLILLAVLNSFLSSSRTEMLRCIVTAVVLYDIFQYWKTGSGVKCSLSLLIKLMAFAVALSAAFSALRYFAGRMNDSDTISYVSFYLGQSIHNLDLFLQDKNVKPEIWGRETFSGLSRLIYHITSDKTYDLMGHKEFRIVRGVNLGNVYTMFRAYIHDFGYAGMIILTALCSFTCNFAYRAIRASVWRRKKIDYYIPALYYALFAFGVYFAFFTDYYFYLIGLGLITKDLIAFWGFELILTRLTWGKSERGDGYGTVVIGNRSGL